MSIEQFKDFDSNKTLEVPQGLPEQNIKKNSENKTENLKNIEDIIDNPETLSQIREKEMAIKIGDLAAETRYNLPLLEQSSNLDKDSIQEAKQEIKLDEKLRNLNEQALKLFENFKKKIEAILHSKKPEKTSKEEKEEGPPIKPGEIFDPVKEMHKILNQPSLEEQKKAYQEYQKKLIYQKQGLARMQEELIMYIRTNPDINKDKLLEIFDQWGKKYGFTPQQRKVTELILNKYEEKHKAVKEIREKFPDDHLLFENLFGVFASGKLEVIEGPMHLYFKCHNFRDFSRVYYFHDKIYFDDSQIDEKTREEAHKVKGFCCSPNLGLLDPDLESKLAKSLIVENSSQIDENDSSERIYKHEEQHVINYLFRILPLEMQNEMKYFPKGGIIKQQEMLNSLKDKKDTDFLEFLEFYFRNERRDWEEQIKDEIIAYMTDVKATPNTIFKNLVESDDGIYDYFNSKRVFYESGNFITFKQKLIEENLQIGKDAGIINQQNYSKYQQLIEKIYHKIFDLEWKELIYNGLEAFQSLLDNGYSREQAIALLVQEPLYQWKIKSKRLVENKKM